MKSWLAQFKFSASLDEGRTSAFATHQPLPSAKVDDFERTTAALHAALHAEHLPDPEVPAGLHAGIMRTVGMVNQPAPVQVLSLLGRRFAFMVTALVLVTGLWWVLPRELQPKSNSMATHSQTLAAAGSALELGEEVISTMPSALIAPLADELARLNRDLDRTAEFFLASLP